MASDKDFKDTKKIEEEFGKKYSIPTELITGEITRESKFFEIKRKLNEEKFTRLNFAFFGFGFGAV